jgi:putative ABC transport system permease protein
MTAPWHKAIRDIWQERTRTILVILAISIGIAGFSTVMSTYAILTRELDRGYLATNPASATLFSDVIDDDLVAAIKSQTAVSDAEPRRTVHARIRTGPMEWRGLTLFVVKDYGDIRVSTLNRETGAWPPGTGELLIERDAFQVAKAKIGDTVTIKNADGDEHTLRVTGGVHDVGQAQARMENAVYGYITLATLAQIGEEPYLDQLKILVANDRLNEAHIRNVVEDVKRVMETRGHPARRVDIPEPGKHPHAALTGTLLLIISTFGLFVLFLSGIIATNLLTAMMASQVRQIGVMQAVGGSRLQIARIYLAQSLLLGACAVILAIPAGMWGARVMSLYMAKFLNFDITSFAVPSWVYLLVAAVGMIVPLLCALYPVWHAADISIREALSSYGISGNKLRMSLFDRALAGIARPQLFAIRNSFRRRTRVLLTIATLAAGGVFFMSALNLRSSMIHTLDGLFAQRKYDLSVQFAELSDTEAIERAVKSTRGIARAETWIVSQGSATPGKAPSMSHSGGGLHRAPMTLDKDSFTIIALPADTQLMKPEVIAGRALKPGDEDTMVINSALTTRMQLGKQVKIQMGPGQPTFRIVGIVREPFSPAVAYIPRAFFDARHPGMANSLRLKLDGATPINQVKADLEANLRKEGLRPTSSMSNSDGRYGFDQHMLMIYIFLIVMSSVIALVGGLGLMTTMSLNVMERRREMGILRAIGATPAIIWLMIVMEGVFIGIMSWLLATLIAAPLSKAVSAMLFMAMMKSRLDSVIEIPGILIWLAISISLGAIASFLPAWHASRSSVREALGYE